MNLSLCAVICCIAVSCLASGLANETANSKKSSPKNPSKDAIPIDDEDAEVEGSGFEENRYDLESSGSGYGPDDEDSDHGTGPFKINPKSGRGGDVTIPMPSSTTKPMSSSSAPTSKPISESPPMPDENSRSIPVDPSTDENKNTLRNNNFNPVEIENRATTPKKSIDEEIIFDNHHPDDKSVDDNKSENNGVYKVTTPDRDRATSFFAQPGILAAVIGGAVVGLLCAILVVMFIVYRMRKKDEGSYPLEEMKRCPAYNPYMKPTHREFFA